MVLPLSRAVSRHLPAALLVIFSSGLDAQGSGARLTGRVTDAQSGRPLPGVRVSLVGTQVVTGTNADGRYALVSLGAGSADVRAQILGFEPQKKTVALVSGQSATLDFNLTPAAISLDPVVTTATGDQRKLEVGNTVATIDAAKLVESSPIANMSDLLTAKAAGVQVLGGNLTGAGQRIRIRGTNSVSLNNEPIFFIDGIRMTSDNNSASIGIGGTNPSRLNDINPEDIESIEVVKGPAASTLYGTDAANGVIVIKTKRGRAGPAQWNVYYETGLIEDRNRWPDAYRGWRTGATNATNSTVLNSTTCMLPESAAGTCRQDSVTKFNVFKDPRTTPLVGGNRSQVGVSVGGGSDVARYFVGSEFERERGVLGTPEVSRNIFQRRLGYDMTEWQVRPNNYQRANLRANLNFSPSQRADFSISTLFVQSDQRLPQTDNNATGLLSNALSGVGNYDSVRVGYRQFRPHDSFANFTQQKVNRYVGGVTANYRPLNWLSGRGTLGVDYTGRNEYALCKRDECGLGVAANLFNRGVGFAQNNRAEFFQYTADGGLNATWRPRTDIELRSAAGSQFVSRRFERNGAFGENLPSGATLAGQAVIPQVAQIQNESRTLGFYVDETVAWRDRLFINAALRRDENSAFGADFGALVLPKGSVSYIVSDEGWFPKTPYLSSLRLRVARGEAATQPNATSALMFFGTEVITEQTTDVPAIVFSALGNNRLKPERVSETEFGADLGAWNNRATVEVTFYNRRSRDGLLTRVLPPSTGGPASRIENIGEVQNRGYELLVSTRLLDRDAIGWDVSINGSHNKNTLLALGRGADSIPPIIGTTLRQVPGFPLDGYWQRPIKRFGDSNGNGIIELSEIEVGDTAVFVGASVPINEFSIQSGIDLFKRKVRISALFDYKGGHYLNNGTERIRCETRFNCRGAVDPNAPLWMQARAVAVRVHGSRTQHGFMEKADFWRFRELSGQVTVPDNLIKHLRVARSASVVLAARNLKIWTDYSGIDPESNYFDGARGTVSDFQTQPPPTYFTLRLNLGL